MAAIANRIACSDHPFAVIMKPTDKCNLRCGYCYVPHRGHHLRMTRDVLKASMSMLSAMLGWRRQLHFIWHGGEPLAMPLSFFEEAVALQRELFPGWFIDNCVQTNGTLLTPEHVAFFADRGFSVSLSIDGPADLHDKNRTFANGRGSYRRVLEAVSLLRERNQAVGAVVVMTPDIAANIERVYRTMRELRINFRINPVIQIAGDRSASPRYAVTPDDYAQAMIALFDLWFEDDVPLHVDPFNLIVGNMISDTVWGCDYHGGCLRDVICVDPDGGVYPCGQLAGRPEFRLGNVLKDDAPAIFAAPMYARLLDRRHLGIAACEGCHHRRICNGGCPVAAYMRGDMLGRDYFCEGRHRLFDHIRRRIEEDVARQAATPLPAPRTGGQCDGRPRPAG
ncbi:putative arylsulfatase regulatory protein [Blastochloris viridis]|uniref:Putative arylsulfatase regulatory protein n=1 Tax=Blastochloris viridis TaxID=1079 RepID=A0A182D3B5_BLAVI|nr:putative arylsulfatase regulatory protein [Blastochloris viridis]